MQCPNCHSTRVRKASAVYLEGTSTSTTRIRGGGIGLGGHRVGLGGFIGRSAGRSTSLAARRADKARIIWIGPLRALALFILLSVIFLAVGLSDPFGIALLVTVITAIACPLVTWVLADFANEDYDRRWYCDSCGEQWTNKISVK